MWDNGNGYKPGFSYDRFNFRSNLDFTITKTTSVKLNLAGMYGVQKSNRAGYNINGAMMDGSALSAYYALPPNAFLPRYADGRWGQSPNSDAGMINSAARVAVHRLRHRFGERFRAEVAKTVLDSAEADDEIRHLLAAVSL